MENFNLRKFLYNNTLITENQEMEEVSSKIKKSELKEKIRAEIMSTLSEEDTNVEEGFGKTLKYAAAGALGALGIKKYGQQLLGKLFNALPEDMAQQLNDIINYAANEGIFDTLSGLFEDEGDDELDAALDAAEDEAGDEAPADDAPADEAPAGPELSDEAGLSDEETDIQQNLKKAYDNAVSLGDEKLANQIANTITFFTRAHVVPRND